MMPFFENKEEEIFYHTTNAMNFPAHLHHHVELNYVIEGQTEVLIGAQWHTITKGEMIVVFPGEVHSYRTLKESQTITVIVPLSFLAPLKSFYRDNQPVSPVINKQNMPKALVENIKEIEIIKQEHVKRALVHLVFARILCCVSLQPRTAYGCDTLIYSAIKEIGNTYNSNIQLGTVALKLGVSSYYLSRVLNNATGMNFREYINSLRIADAQQMLLNEEYSILEIALACGFQNLRTFNRAFLSCSSCTPKEYRKRGAFL